NETTGEYRIPYNYSDVWNGTTPRGNNIYTYDWDTTSLNPDEWLTHGYIIVFKVTDNNSQPNTVYQSVGVWVDNDYPSIISGPLVRSENNVEEREDSRSVIYTKESVGSLSFALYDLRLAMYYDIDENQSWANLEAYLNCLNISILDEYENGSQVFNSCEIVNGSGGLFLEVRNYPLYSGRHNLTLTVTDLAGNTNQSVHTVDIVVDQVPPIVIPVLPRTGMWLKRVINANPFAEAFDWFAYSFLSTMGWILDLLKLNYEQTWNMIGDDWMEGVLFGAYVDDFDSPVLNETIYVQLNYRPGLLYRMTSDYMIYLDSMDEHPCDRLLAQGEQFRSALGGELYSRILSCSGYQDLGLTIFEEWYGDNVFWTAVELSPWDFPLNIWSQSWLNPNTFTCKFSAWDKAGNLGTAYSTFGVIPYASALTLQFDMTSASWFLTGLFGCQAYIDAVQSEITLVTSGRKGGENQGGACMSHGVSSSEPNTDANLLYSASYPTPAENGGVCMGDGEGENETGCDPLDSLITVESTLNYEFYEETSFLPWMKFSFRVFGAPRDISLNVKFGQAPFIRLFFDPLSFQKYGRGEDSVLLRAAPNTWNTFALPLYRMAEGLGLFEGLNAPTNISAVSVTAYGERNVWERRAVFNGFWVATPVPLVEEYAEKAALSRDNYYRILNVTRESNLNQLKEDIFEIFAASYLEDFPHLAQCLEDFTRHLFPAGEMQEFTGASARVVYYNTSSGSAPLYVVYSFPEGLENVSLLAAYNYTNIPDVDLSREAVLNASLTNLCRQLAQGGGAITPYGLTGEDLAYLPYGAASFVIVNDTLCFDRLSARPCTIQSVLATVASIAERAWSQKCIAELVEREVEYREVEALQAFVNESVYRVETLKKLMAALQWVNYMHPMNWDWKSFDALVDTYWLSFEYAGWANSTGYQLLAECLVNITGMLDFGDYFGAPPVFITSGEYNRTSGGEGEDCVLIFKAVEGERSLDYLLGARQGEVLFAVFNDSSFLNVVRKYGRCVNATLADVYLYFAEMAFMYTVPYDAEDLLNDGVFNAVSELCSSLFAGPLAMLEQIVGNVKDVVECFLNLPFINLVSTLNALFMQKFTKKLAIFGVSNYVGWLLEEEAANYEADYYSDMDDGGVAQPGQTFFPRWKYGEGLQPALP
ncbi:MAG: hypothetical protein Q6366_001525, partial [Candidatus Freyarchaeota archaeon]